MMHVVILALLVCSVCITSCASQPITLESAAQSINKAPMTIAGSGVLETVYGFPDVFASYSIAHPEIRFKMGAGPGPANREGVEKGTLDFGFSSGPMLLDESIKYPNITFLPIVATGIVPIYRLDAAINDTLTFSLSTLAYIYAGQLTNWNDSRIRADNPGVNLPDQPITVVTYGEPRYVTDIWIRALNRALPNVSSILPTPSSGLSWPFGSYSASMTGTGIQGVAAIVVDNDGAIGYCIQAAAVTTGARTAPVINSYGTNVTANTLSVSYAVSERSLQNIPNPLIQVPDLTGCTSMSCWPIVEPIFVVIENYIAPHGCELKAELVRFLQFYYSSTEITRKLLGAYQMVNIPSEVQESLDVSAQLARITCFGAPLSNTNSAAQKVVSVGVTDSMHEFIEAEGTFYQMVDASFSFNAVTLPPFDAVRSVQTGSLAANFYYRKDVESEVSSISGQALLDTKRFLHLPMFLTSTAFVYNPILSMKSSNTSYSVPETNQLKMDVDLLVQVLLGDVSSWHSEKWLQYNDWLPSVLVNKTKPAPVTVIVGCTSNAQVSPMTTRLFKWINDQIVDRTLQRSFYQTFLSTEPSNSTKTTAFRSCQKDQALPTVEYSTKETGHQQLVNAKPGSFSFIRDNVDAQTNKFILEYNGNPRVSSVSALKSCIASQGDAGVLALDISSGAVSNSSCWPLTDVLMVQVAKDFGKDGMLAWRTLSWLQTLVNSSSADYWSDNMMAVRVAQHTGMYAALTQALYTVVANGETVIITYPILWELNDSIFLFGTVFVALIGLLTVASMIFFVLFRNYKIIRSNSPMFLCISLTGILLLLACIQLLVITPSDATCSAVNWTANLGFQVTFMPLFAKAWRIYRIFGGRKLQVVKINNRKLAMIVGIGLSLETLFLIIWQAVAPASALTVSQYEDYRVHNYVQCGYDDKSMDFFLASVVVKVVLVLFGVRMAFGTRQVSDEFSESKSIAVAIYNLIVAVGLIAALIVLMETVGDTLILLLVFCAVWVSLVTLFILVGPRILTFIDSRRPRGTVDPQFVTSRSSLSGEYSFLSLNVLNSLQMAMTYMQSLESHMTDVRSRVSQLRGHMNVGEASTKVGSKTAPSPKPSPTKSTIAFSPKLATPQLTPSEARRTSLQNRNTRASSGTPLAVTTPISVDTVAPNVDKVSPTHNEAASATPKPISSPHTQPRFSHSVQMSNVAKNPVSVSKGSWI